MSEVAKSIVDLLLQGRILEAVLQFWTVSLGRFFYAIFFFFTAFLLWLKLKDFVITALIMIPVVALFSLIIAPECTIFVVIFIVLAIATIFYRVAKSKY